MNRVQETRSRVTLVENRANGSCGTIGTASQNQLNTDRLPALLTTAQASEFLNLSVNTVRSLCASGELPARHIGRSWRIPRGLLLEYLGYESEVN